MFNTVLPLMARKRLPDTPNMICQPMIGQRPLMNPAKPVANNSPVCKLFIRGQ